MKTRAWKVGMAVVATGAAVVAGASTPTVTARSYEEVRDRVLASPLTTMPDRGKVDLPAFLRAAYTGTGAVMERATGLFTQRTDLREPAVKLTHSSGVCMEATWDIDRGPATGLLAPGTHMPALVRFSSATNEPTDTGAGRSFSLAIKLFPALSTAARVPSVNLVTSDQFGIDGIRRHSATQLEPEHGPIVYMNTIGGGSFAADIVGKAFRRVDRDAGERPLYPLTTIMPDGSSVPVATTPRRIHFIQRKVHPVEVRADFREELLQYETNELVFDIHLPPQEAVPHGMTIGKLTLGKPMVTDACDLELVFFHHPTDPARDVR